MRRYVAIAWTLCGAIATAGCTSEDTDSPKETGGWPPIVLDAASKAPASIATTGLARLVDGKLEYHPELVPYDLTMPLFSDYALKRRAMWIPKGTKLKWHANEPLEFPPGSIIVKSFLFPADLRTPDKDVEAIETRVMVRGETQWKAWPYVWDTATGEGKLKVAGTVRDISFIDEAGKEQKSAYLVPQRNQCLDCHDKNVGKDKLTGIIGPRARFLNRDHVYDDAKKNQLQHLKAIGWLPDLPGDVSKDVAKAASMDNVKATTVAKLTGEPLRKATRDYLDMNCAHCHSPWAVEGETSQLYLNHDNADKFLLGVCKAPSSAGKGGFGRKYDIVPGQPDKSIMVYRMETTELGAMMPDIGRSLAHGVGVALVRKWIEEMAPVQCNR